MVWVACLSVGIPRDTVTMVEEEEEVEQEYHIGGRKGSLSLSSHSHYFGSQLLSISCRLHLSLGIKRNEECKKSPQVEHTTRTPKDEDARGTVSSRREKSSSIISIHSSERHRRTHHSLF